MAADFKLSAQLVGHDSDVRSVAFPAPDTVITASRDTSVRVWHRKQSSPPEFEAHITSQGSDYINAVASYPPSATFPKGLVISGGRDTLVEVRTPTMAPTDNAVRLLVGHAHTVAALDVLPGGKHIVSGGWDGQARVWNLEKGESEFMLSGHEGTVWTVVAVSDKIVVTGCADKQIRIFDLGTAIAGDVQPKSAIYTPDIIRGLCRVPRGHVTGAALASSHNDGAIRLWKLNGQMMAELHGHDSFVYSLTALPTGELVSSGEDRTVRIWKGTECIQTITLPAISVWSVAACAESGDIVAGASDGLARIFTRDPSRVASAETVAAFDESVKASAIPQQQMGNINTEKLPGPEWLKTKAGTKEGQVQMIKEEDGSISAHTWSMSQQQWINVGTVVDSAGSSGKKAEYQGKQYDYVFDVDIEEGKPPLKLPFNLSQNPFDAARKFLEDNKVPLTYLDEVVNFIKQNTGATSLGEDSGSGADPYGTESRYRPGDEARPAKAKILPQTQYLSITAAKHDAIVNKILSINQNMISSGRKEFALNPKDQEVLREAREALVKSKPITEDGFALIVRMVADWDYADRMPGLDLLRCVVSTPFVAQYKDRRFDSVVDMAINSSLDSPEGTQPSENCVLMALRAIANLFQSAQGAAVAAKEVETVVTYIERVVGMDQQPAIGKYNRNVLIAATTSILNYAVLATKSKTAANPELQNRFVQILGGIISEQTDSEVVYRALVALGTWLHLSPGGGAEAKAWVIGAVAKIEEDRIKNVVEECLAKIR